jgi:hypothetical protein
MFRHDQVKHRLEPVILSEVAPEVEGPVFLALPSAQQIFPPRTTTWVDADNN